MTWLWGVLAFVVAQRLGELWLANRNTRRLLDDGAREHGAGHYPLFVALHGGWIAAIGLLVDPDIQPSIPLLVLFALLQLGRVWVIATLGRYWTTRVISMPGAPLITAGPYRLVRHPNYVIVTGEIAVLPLAFGAWEIAVVFSLLNAGLLAWRLRVENRVLDQRMTTSGCSAGSARTASEDPG